MKEIFDKIVLGCKTNDENLMEANIKNWMAKDLPNPFEQNTAAHELYYNAQMAYKRWAKKVINYRRSKVEMVEYVKQLIDSGVTNPYAPKPEIKEDPVPEIKEEVKQEVEEESKQEKDIIHVLGVLPEEPESQPEKNPEKKPGRKAAEKKSKLFSKK